MRRYPEPSIRVGLGVPNRHEVGGEGFSWRWSVTSLEVASRVVSPTSRVFSSHFTFLSSFWVALTDPLDRTTSNDFSEPRHS